VKVIIQNVLIMGGAHAAFGAKVGSVLNGRLSAQFFAASSNLGDALIVVGGGVVLFCDLLPLTLRPLRRTVIVEDVIIGLQGAVDQATLRE
jgi:hypothetical protein